MFNKLFAISLARISFLNLREKILLSTNLKTAEELSLVSFDDISKIVKRTIRAQWNGKKNLHDAECELFIIEKRNIEMILHGDAFYPALLREITNPPFALFCRGTVSSLCEKTISIVGTRRMTISGKNAAHDFAYEAAVDGFTIVSGLAHGIDGEAHKGAVDANFDNDGNARIGKTIAILPCGCDAIVPRSHVTLAEKILQTGGVLVSEYVPGVESEAWRFVHRNRIIAGFSPATLVVESPPGSGALLTAQFALDANRDVFFHEAAFSEQAKKMSAAVLQKLKNDAETKKLSKAKLENTNERFVRDGACVIKNYQDFLEAKKNPPAHRVKNLELFSEK